MEEKAKEPALLPESKAWKDGNGDRLIAAIVSQGAFLRACYAAGRQGGGGWECMETTLGRVVRAVADHSKTKREFERFAESNGPCQLSELPAMAARGSGGHGA